MSSSFSSALAEKESAVGDDARCSRGGSAADEWLANADVDWARSLRTDRHWLLWRGRSTSATSMLSSASKESGALGKHRNTLEIAC